MSATPILPRIASGDETAVSECISRYGGLVWSLARRFLSDQTEAEDAVQEIFLALWQNASRFDSGRASEPTFIAVIARRRLIDRRRKQSSRVSPGSLEAEPDSGDQSPEQRLVLADDAAKAAATLESLPEQESRLLKLSIYNGMTHSEIADSTGIALGTVKTGIRRGLIRLREKLIGTTGTERGVKA